MEESPSKEPPPEPERPPGGEETAHETMEMQSDNPTPAPQERARELFREISDPAEPPPVKRDFSTAPKEKLRERTKTAPIPKEKPGIIPKTASTPKERPRGELAPVRDSRRGTEPPCTPRPVRGDKDTPVPEHWEPPKSRAKERLAENRAKIGDTAILEPWEQSGHWEDRPMPWEKRPETLKEQAKRKLAERGPRKGEVMAPIPSPCTEVQKPEPSPKGDAPPGRPPQRTERKEQEC